MLPVLDLLGLRFRRDVKSDNSIYSIWHKLIPGTAISLQILLESTLGSIFGTQRCSGTGEAVFRTVAFVIAYVAGLKSMKWSFESEAHLSEKKRQSKRIKHALVNIGVVTAWIFAVSDYPLMCWMPTVSERSINMIKGSLIVLAQVIVSFELFEFPIIDDANDSSTADERSRLLI